MKTIVCSFFLLSTFMIARNVQAGPLRTICNSLLSSAKGANQIKKELANKELEYARLSHEWEALSGAGPWNDALKRVKDKTIRVKNELQALHNELAILGMEYSSVPLNNSQVGIEIGMAEASKQPPRVDQRTRIKFLSARESEEYQLAVPGVQLKWKDKAVNGVNLLAVMSPKGEIYIMPPGSNLLEDGTRINAASFTAGGPVAAVAFLTVTDGELKEIHLPDQNGLPYEMKSKINEQIVAQFRIDGVHLRGVKLINGKSETTITR